VFVSTQVLKEAKSKVCFACGSLPAIGEKDFTLTVLQRNGPQDPFLQFKVLHVAKVNLTLLDCDGYKLFRKRK
jgi:hypothetical protein